LSYPSYAIPNRDATTAPTITPTNPQANKPSSPSGVWELTNLVPIRPPINAPVATDAKNIILSFCV
jgi:hypothetical protein